MAKSILRAALALLALCAAIQGATVAAQNPAGQPQGMTIERLESLLTRGFPKAEIVRGETIAKGINVVFGPDFQTNVQLQTCENRETATGCKVLSAVTDLVSLTKEERQGGLELVNRLNATDIHGRTFISPRDVIVMRFSMLILGTESDADIVMRLANWLAYAESVRSLPENKPSE
jgi:hypothetical protein